GLDVRLCGGGGSADQGAVGGSLRVLGGQVAFGVQSGRTASSGGGDRLPVVVVHHVSGGEHPLEVGAGARVLHVDVALGVQRHLTLDELGAGQVPDRHEHTGGTDLALLAGDGVAQGDAGDLAVAVDGDHLGVPREGDLLVRQRAVGDRKSV